MTDRRVSQVILEVAETPTTVQRRISQVILEVAYTAGTDATASPSRVVGTGAVPGATTIGTAVALPAAVAGVGSVPAATGIGDLTATPATVAGVGAVPSPNVSGFAAPYVHDVITNTGTGVTSISLDFSTLDVTDVHSKVVMFFAVKTTTSIALPTINGSPFPVNGFGWAQGVSSANAQLFIAYGNVLPTNIGNLTFAWSGAHDVVVAAFCIEAAGRQVYLEDIQSGSATDNTFDAFSFNLDGGDQLLLMAGATNTGSLSTVTPPTDFPDHTYGPYTSNSAISLLAIDADKAAVTTYDATTWTVSDDTVQDDFVGFIVGFSSYASPGNDDLADAEVLSTYTGSVAGSYTGAWLESAAEGEDSSYWSGNTAWYTFTGRGGPWTIKVNGSNVPYPLMILYAGGYFALYEADIGETDESVIYAGYVAPDSDVFSGGANNDLNYAATFNALDNTKQYWIQVDSTYGPTYADFTLLWETPTAIPGTVVGTGAVPAPTAVGSAAGEATPNVVIGTGAVPAPSVQTGDAPAPTVAGTGAVPAPTIIRNALPARVGGTSAVPAPTVIGVQNPIAFPPVVAGRGRVQRPFFPSSVDPGGGSGGSGGGGTSEVSTFWTIYLGPSDGGGA